MAAKAPLADDDGRRARSERTRAAVVEALLNLLGEGIMHPGADLVAERAGVSRRAIFNHFHDLEDLFATAADLQRTRVMGLFQPISPEAPLPERIAAFTAQQARVITFIAPVRRASNLVAHASPVVAERLASMRAFHRARLEATFAPELADLEGEARREQIAALTTVTSFPFWEELTAHEGLTPRMAEQAMARALTALLAAPPRALSQAR